MIKVEGVGFRYPTAENPALLDINLEITEGEMLAVVGPNGSGKSTLAKLFNGILLPGRGSVRVDDLSTEDDDLFEIRKRVGLVFQNPDNQIVASIVERDVAFALENLGVPREEMHQRVAWALQVTGLEIKKKSLTHQLSGGQKQRLAIAGMIAMRPKYLVLDEPFAMLDPKGKGEVLEVLHKLRREGITVILVTQYMDTVLEVDRVVALQAGNIAADESPATFFADWDRIHQLSLEVPLAYRMMEKIRKVTGIEETELSLTKWREKILAHVHIQGEVKS
jgi:energy-coupling factor transport system ATP-binding protein